MAIVLAGTGATAIAAGAAVATEVAVTPAATATVAATTTIAGATADATATTADIAAAMLDACATLKTLFTSGLLYDEHPLPELCGAKRSTEAVRHALVQQKFQQAMHTQ